MVQHVLIMRVSNRKLLFAPEYQNARMLEHWDAQPWAKQYRKRKLQFAGKLAQHVDGRWSRLVLDLEPQVGDGRSIGRPRTRWCDDVVAVAGLDWLTLARDAEQWGSLQEAFCCICFFASSDVTWMFLLCVAVNALRLRLGLVQDACDPLCLRLGLVQDVLPFFRSFCCLVSLLSLVVGRLEFFAPALGPCSRCLPFFVPTLGPCTRYQVVC